MTHTADDYVVELHNYLYNRYMADGGDDEQLRFFEYEEKPKSWKGCYIAINALPFVFGHALNDKNIINVNVHVPTFSNGTLNRALLNKWEDFVCDEIPVDGAYEEDKMLSLELAHYCITNITQPRKDNDNTHYVNFQIKVITHQ